MMRHFFGLVKKKNKNDKTDKKGKHKSLSVTSQDITPVTSIAKLVPADPLNGSGIMGSTVLAPREDVEMADVPLEEIIQLYRAFHATVWGGASENAQMAGVKRLKALSVQLADSNCVLTPAELCSGFDLSFRPQSLLERILSAPPMVRVRYAFALYRFCVVFLQDAEDLMFSSGTGLLAGFSNVNTLITSGDECNPSSVVPRIEPLDQELDLIQLYKRLEKEEDFLPSAQEMGEVLRLAKELFRSSDTVVMVPLPAVVVGDLHGQLRDLLYHILPAGGSLVSDAILSGAASKDAARGCAGTNYLFLGDYVDRGPYSLHCLCLLFVAKLLSPESVFLLRGNHESPMTNRHYGFLEECHRNYPIVNGRVTSSSSVDAATNTRSCDGDDEAGGDPSCRGAFLGGSEWNLPDHPLWVMANDVFEYLPLCAAIYEVQGASERDDSVHSPAKRVVHVCAMHGGLSPYIENSIDGILAVRRSRDIQVGALADLTWADPFTSTRSNTTIGNSLTEQLVSPLKLPSSEDVTDWDYDVPPAYMGPPVGFAFSARGTGHTFGEDVTCSFVVANKIRFIVRAHQCVQEGFQWAHQNRLLTVFSATNYCGIGNKGAVLLLDAIGRPTIKQYESVDCVEGIPRPAPVPPREFC